MVHDLVTIPKHTVSAPCLDETYVYKIRGVTLNGAETRN
jgi:hypothetical protein